MAHELRFAARLLLLIVATSLATPAAAHVSIVIDGFNDFPPAQAVAGADGSTWYFASDATHFYFGLSHPDVSSGTSERFLTLYLDTDPQPNPLMGQGATTGGLYGTQQPTLPVRADMHIRWLSDNGFEGVLAWDGAAWLPVSADPIDQLNGATSFVEFAISRSDLAAADGISLIGSLVYDTPVLEQTYAFVPPTTTAGYDPDPVGFLSRALFMPPAVPGVGLLGGALVAGMCMGVDHCARRRSRESSI